MKVRHFGDALLLLVAAVTGALQFRTGISPFALKPFATLVAGKVPAAEPSAGAFGMSGGVLLRFAMPAEEIEYPLDVHGDPTALGYQLSLIHI